MAFSFHSLSDLLARLRAVALPDNGSSETLDRGRDRYRRATWSALATLAARTVSIATGLITVPLTLSYLGQERYGLWMALTGLVAFLSFSDMGLGIGLQNALSRCHGNDDKEGPRAYVSTAMVLIFGVSFALCLFALFVLPHIPLERLLKSVDPVARAELLPTAQAMALTFALGLPCGLIQRIYNAYQRGYRATLWLSIGQVLGLLAILLCIYLELGLPWLAVCLMGMPLIALAFGGVSLFRQCPWLRPSFRSLSWRHLRPIAGTGSSAVAAQAAAVVLISGPLVLIANCLGTAAVTPFAVTQKLLGVSFVLLGMAVMPLWPAYGEAAERGDWAWVKRTFRRTLILGFSIQIPLFILLAVTGESIIRIWAGPDAVPTWSLLMAVNVWFLVGVVNICCSIALNGLDHLLGQAIYGPIFAVAACVAAYILLPTHGVAAAIWAVVLVGILPNGICAGFELTWVMATRRRHGHLGPILLRWLRARR